MPFQREAVKSGFSVLATGESAVCGSALPQVKSQSLRYGISARRGVRWDTVIVSRPVTKALFFQIHFALRQSRYVGISGRVRPPSEFLLHDSTTPLRFSTAPFTFLLYHKNAVMSRHKSKKADKKIPAKRRILYATGKKESSKYLTNERNCAILIKATG